MAKQKTKPVPKKSKQLQLADEAINLHQFVHGQIMLVERCLDLLKEHVMQSYPDHKLDAIGAMKVLAAAQVFLGDAHERSKRLGGAVMEMRQYQ